MQSGGAAVLRLALASSKVGTRGVLVANAVRAARKAVNSSFREFEAEY